MISEGEYNDKKIINDLVNDWSNDKDKVLRYTAICNRIAKHNILEQLPDPSEELIKKCKKNKTSIFNNENLKQYYDGVYACTDLQFGETTEFICNKGYISNYDEQESQKVYIRSFGFIQYFYLKFKVETVNGNKIDNSNDEYHELGDEIEYEKIVKPQVENELHFASQSNVNAFLDKLGQSLGYKYKKCIIGGHLHYGYEDVGCACGKTYMLKIYLGGLNIPSSDEIRNALSRMKKCPFQPLCLSSAVPLYSKFLSKNQLTECGHLRIPGVNYNDMQSDVLNRYKLHNIFYKDIEFDSIRSFKMSKSDMLKAINFIKSEFKNMIIDSDNLPKKLQHSDMYKWHTEIARHYISRKYHDEFVPAIDEIVQTDDDDSDKWNWSKIKELFFKPFFSKDKVIANIDHIKCIYFRAIDQYSTEFTRVTTINDIDNIDLFNRKIIDFRNKIISNPNCTIRHFILDICAFCCDFRTMLKSLWFDRIVPNLMTEQLDNWQREKSLNIMRHIKIVTWDIETTFIRGTGKRINEANDDDDENPNNGDDNNEGSEQKIIMISLILHDGGAHKHRPFQRIVLLTVPKTRINDGEYYKDEKYYDIIFIKEECMRALNVDSYENFKIEVLTSELDLINRFFELCRNFDISLHAHFNGCRFDMPMLYIRAILCNANLLPLNFKGIPMISEYPICVYGETDKFKRMRVAMPQNYNMSFSHRHDLIKVTYQNPSSANVDKKNAIKKYRKKNMTMYKKKLANVIKTTDDLNSIISLDNSKSLSSSLSSSNVTMSLPHDSQDEIDILAKQFLAIDLDDDGHYVFNDSMDIDIDEISEGGLIQCGNLMKKGPFSFDEQSSLKMDKRKQILSHLLICKKIMHNKAIETCGVDVMHLAGNKINGISLDAVCANQLNLHKIDHPIVSYGNMTNNYLNPESPKTKNDEKEFRSSLNNIKKLTPKQRDIIKKDADAAFTEDAKYKRTKEQLLDPTAQKNRQNLRLGGKNPLTGINAHVLVIYAIIDSELTFRCMHSIDPIELLSAYTQFVPLCHKDLFTNESIKINMSCRFKICNVKNIIDADPFIKKDMTQVYTPGIEYNEDQYINSKSNAAISCHGTEGYYSQFIIAVFDFGAQYPSAMREFNIDPTTRIPAHSLHKLQKHEYITVKLRKCIPRVTQRNPLRGSKVNNFKQTYKIFTRKIYIAKRKKFLGTCTIVAEKYQMKRNKYKRLMKLYACKNKRLHALYDSNQYACKILNNSIYGMISRISTDNGSSVTKTGRTQTQYAAILLNKGMCMETVNSDTDSVFVLQPYFSLEPIPNERPENGGMYNKNDVGPIRRIVTRLIKLGALYDYDKFKQDLLKNNDNNNNNNNNEELRYSIYNIPPPPSHKYIIDTYMKYITKPVDMFNEGSYWSDDIEIANRYADTEKYLFKISPNVKQMDKLLNNKYSNYWKNINNTIHDKYFTII